MFQIQRCLAACLMAIGTPLLAGCGGSAPAATPTPPPASAAPTPSAVPTEPPTETATASPTTPPTATAEQVDFQTWADVDFVLSDTCGRCHNGETLKGDLDLTSYQAALAGGSSGPGIVVGNPDASGIVRKQQIGGHYAQLSQAQLQALRAWIAAGAPSE